MKHLNVVLICFGLTAVLGSLNEDCSNYNGQDACQGSQHDEPDERDNRMWQTPPRGSERWRESYQDLGSLAGHIQVVYDNTELSSATVNVIMSTRDDSVSLEYVFDGASSDDATFAVDASSHPNEPLSVVVKGSDGSSHTFPPQYFRWQAPVVEDVPAFEGGQKGGVVELFGWPYTEIEKECETLGQLGWMGVKIFPPQGSVFSNTQVQGRELNPWWFLYQPTSYNLDGRAGTQAELKAMIDTCREAGVRVYADAVVNHMSGCGNDVGEHRTDTGGGNCAYWGGKESTDGSPYFTQCFAYEENEWTGEHPGQEFPSVPYNPTHFHCERTLKSWSDPEDLNYGWLVGLTDLNTEHPYVRQRIADYFTNLLSLGISGVRVDAAKHISPDNLAAIFALLKNNMGGHLPSDFMAYLEVLIGGEKDLLFCQDGDYNFGPSFTAKLSEAGLEADEVDMIKIWSSDYPKEWPACGYDAVSQERLVVQNDCHDDQTPGSSSRDMGDSGSVLVIEKDVGKHRHFEVSLFQHGANFKHRMVLSSYTLRDDTNGEDGFPDGLSDCSKCEGEACVNCVSVPYSPAYDESSCGYDVYTDDGSWAESKYTRVHRDPEIVAAMREWLGLGALPNGLPNCYYE